MTDKERFVATMKFGTVDRPPLVEWGYWEETITRWRNEGLPKDVYPWRYLGLDRWNGSCEPDIPGGGLGMWPNPKPPYERIVFEDTPDYQVVRVENGIVQKELKRGVSMPHWIEFPVKDRVSWQEYKSRLDPDAPGHVREDLDETAVNALNNRDFVLIFSSGGSFFGFIRNAVGLENLLYLYYDDPALVHEMGEHFENFFYSCVRRILNRVKVDVVNFWEDMAMKGGPLISPSIFREFMLPRYKRLVNFYRSYGVEIFSVDSDGDINNLIPLFIEAGITIFHPLEIAAGMDPLALRKRYGKDIGMWGSIDKRALIAGKESIRQEVMGKVPQLIEKGGYVPFVDHHVPPDVSYENYVYYQNCLREIFGMERLKV